jgi:hypothetical protein
MKAGVPWIYDAERPDVHTTSAYNQKPKGTHFKNNYETRLALVRKNLSLMPDRIAKHRSDRIDNKTPTYDEQHLVGVYKVLTSNENAGKHKNQSATKVRQAAVEVDRALGIEGRKSSPTKSVAGSSRGGGLSKKEREITNLGGDLMAGRDPNEV